VSTRRRTSQDVRTDGSGAMTVVRPASNAVDPTVPNLSYMAPANKGNTAPKDERIAVFAPMAEAAIGR
jgi:hypothetical protein